ncbi:MAG TPA: hypothetical protein VIY30_00400 [Burkholderiaceae bacterium]
MLLGVAGALLGGRASRGLPGRAAAIGCRQFRRPHLQQPALARHATALPPHACWHGFAVTDYAVPGVRLMHDIVDAIAAELRRGARVYLHCHAGVGRTGTALGCWLVGQGLAGPAALALIAHKRGALARLAAAPRSPETDAQRAFVLH